MINNFKCRIFIIIFDVKVQPLIAYNCINHFDIICLSEKYLNSDISYDNKNLDIPGYRLVLSVRLSNDKRGDTESINPRVSNTSNRKIMPYQNVQCVIAKYQDLLKKEGRGH